MAPRVFRCTLDMRSPLRLLMSRFGLRVKPARGATDSAIVLLWELSHKCVADIILCLSTISITTSSALWTERIDEKNTGNKLDFCLFWWYTCTMIHCYFWVFYIDAHVIQMKDTNEVQIATDYMKSENIYSSVLASSNLFSCESCQLQYSHSLFETWEGSMTCGWCAGFKARSRGKGGEDECLQLMPQIWTKAVRQY